jgi:hypothetical protein
VITTAHDRRTIIRDVTAGPIDNVVRTTVHDDLARTIYDPLHRPIAHDKRFRRNDHRLADVGGWHDRSRPSNGDHGEERFAVGKAVEIQAHEASPTALEDHARSAVVPAPKFPDFLAPLVDHAELVLLLGRRGRIEVDHDVQILLRTRFGRRGGPGPCHIQPGYVGAQVVDMPRWDGPGPRAQLCRQHQGHPKQEKRPARQ